ncbi:MAG: flagellar hook-associated family protein [Aestuariivirgaceae bacterium]
MKTTLVSTLGINTAVRLSLSKMQNDLVGQQSELSTGRHFDVGMELGHKAGRTVSVRFEHSRLNQIIDTNALVSTRLEMTQEIMSGLVERAQGFIDAVIASRDGFIGQEIAPQEGRVVLSYMVSQMNTSLNGEQLFSGINTDLETLTDYSASPAPASKLAVDAVFLAEFGITQSDPGVASISATAMQTFLDGSFATEFEPAAWSSNWSAASDQNVTSRIAPDTVVETGTNANLEPFRKLAKAFTMMADLGAEDLNKQAFQAVSDTAISLASEAISELSFVQGKMGVDEQRIERSNRMMSLQIDILNNDAAQLESVDAYETSTRINQLISQIEVSYAVTGRLQQLSLVRYL